MDAEQFIRKWGPGGTSDALKERAGAQLHFSDLCALLGVSTPADPEHYCFERGLWGIEGGRRFADVWKRGHFAWEYKAPGGDLGNALAQLMQYALPLENPPLLIVSDRHRIQIHTHFTGHPSVSHALHISDLGQPHSRALLRKIFLAPEGFRPCRDSRVLTADLAACFAGLADSLRARGVPALKVAHFLTQCVFCCFAEDAHLLKNNEFKRTIQSKSDPERLKATLNKLFEKMRTGGDFGVDDEIPWFNGGLFSTVDVPLLKASEVRILAKSANYDWHAIDPTILGTLFERGLDPAKKDLVGAYFTDPATIEKLVEPIVRAPLLAEWDIVKRQISGLLSSRDFLNVRARGVPSKNPELHRRHAALRSHATQAHRKAKNLFDAYLERLRTFRILDPACGSGNFLYVALKALKDVELLANQDAQQLGLQPQFPGTGPQNVLGIEINEYAAELARATVWIGELQWMRAHGLDPDEMPVLKPLNQIECRDALMQANGNEAAWPSADVIVGNPPFVGDKRMRSELGDRRTETLRATFKGRVPGGADLVCYWFEKARAQISTGDLQRAGLVATNAIRQGANRSVLQRLLKETRIFDVWPDEPWVNEGAAVRVSLIAFGKSDQHPRLAGAPVDRIFADLKGASNGNDVDLTSATALPENEGASFFGYCLAGPFTVTGPIARKWLEQPNANGRPNSDVLAPIWNGADLTRRPADRWVVDFGPDMAERDASLFEAPFQHVLREVKPMRAANREAVRIAYWWRHGRPRPELRQAGSGLARWIVTSETSKHRYFAWLPQGVAPEHKLVVFPRADDTTFGLLSSRMHVLWADSTGGRRGVGNDPVYSTSKCLLPFPFPTDLTPADTAPRRTAVMDGGALIPADLRPEARKHAMEIARAAKRLDELREKWLNPPQWCDRVPEVVPLGLARTPYPDRIIAKAGHERELARRTLTILYNERPAWLSQAHEDLDTAVAAAYGWKDYTPSLSDYDVLLRLLALNRHRSVSSDVQRELPLGTSPSKKPTPKGRLRVRSAR